MKKKSFLNSSVIDSKSAINEFEILFPKLVSKIQNFWEKRQYKNAIKLAKKSPEFQKNLKSLNKASVDAEDAFEKQFGVKLDLSRAKLSDFF